MSIYGYGHNGPCEENCNCDRAIASRQYRIKKEEHPCIMCDKKFGTKHALKVHCSLVHKGEFA